MRRKIALVLALVMILSLIPMSSFAATANRVTNVVQAEADKALATKTELVIRDDRNDMASNAQRIYLQLENAEWKSQLDINGLTTPVTGVTSAVYLVRQSSTRLEATFTLDTAGSNDEVKFDLQKLVSKVKEEGDARVTINPLDSAVTGGTYTFATGVKGETVVSTDGTITFGPDLAAKMKNLVVDETTANSVDLTETFEISLPRDFDWAMSTFDVQYSGGFGTASDTLVAAPSTVTTPGAGEFIIDGRDLTFVLDGYTTGTRSSRGTFVIKDLYIESDSERFGDVNATFDGEFSDQTLKIATYADFAVTIEADGDIEEIVAGRWNDGKTDGFALTTMLFEEKIEDSIVGTRNVTVEFPDWVQITKVTEVNGQASDQNVLAMFGNAAGDNEFTFVPGTLEGGSKVQLEFEIEVALEAGAEGDIEALVTGRGLDQDYEVVLGTAVAPVTVDMEMSEIVIGKSSQMIADITITENVEGALMNGDLEILFDIRDLVLQSGVEVEADEDSGLEIDDVTRDGNMLVVEIDRESDEPGVIEITGLVVSMNRIPATGDYDVKFGGLALVDNVDYTSNGDVDEDNTWFDVEYAVETPMLRVVTEASQAAVDVAFTVGMNAYMVEGEVMTMDVAPFVADGRLMIPVRYLEELFGMQPIWNATSRTVTVLYNGMVYEMAIGSTILRVNGAPFMEMDAEAQIVDGRTFVPASRFARAMGIEYSWDAATQTVTFMK